MRKHFIISDMLTIWRARPATILEQKKSIENFDRAYELNANFTPTRIKPEDVPAAIGGKKQGSRRRNRKLHYRQADRIRRQRDLTLQHSKHCNLSSAEDRNKTERVRQWCVRSPPNYPHYLRRVFNKKPGVCWHAPGLIVSVIILSFYNIISLPHWLPADLWTTGNFEFNFLVDFQGFESVSLDGGIMYEYILAVVLGNEAIAFGIIEPLHFTLSQTITLLCCKISGPLSCTWGTCGSLTHTAKLPRIIKQALLAYQKALFLSSVFKEKVW